MSTPLEDLLAAREMMEKAEYVVIGYDGFGAPLYAHQIDERGTE